MLHVVVLLTGKLQWPKEIPQCTSFPWGQFTLSIHEGVYIHKYVILFSFTVDGIPFSALLYTAQKDMIKEY